METIFKIGLISLFFGLFIEICSVKIPETNKENKKTDKIMTYRDLTPEEKSVIIDKGTEIPFTGMYNNHWETGTYHCKQCGAALYKSNDKFDGHCGWPSFDEEIEGAVKRVLDKDGRRTEIICTKCNGHLGHVFEGEGFTDKNIRHCVNSVSLTFEPLRLESEKLKKAYFAGGCFWGMEYYFSKTIGVVDCEVGYMGGKTKNPTYKEVCAGGSGHYEVTEVTYDPKKTNFENIARVFFEIHDPTQTNGQGPDIGEQYLSVAFYASEEEKQTLLKLIAILEKKGFDVATGLLPLSPFWKAEDYHQEYYQKNGKEPYCHGYVKRF